MAIVVTKVELKSVMDASGIAACIKAGAFGADEVVAVIGKTEGKAAVSDVAASGGVRVGRRQALGTAGRRMALSSFLETNESALTPGSESSTVKRTHLRAAW
jgi:hypothetical protein